MNKKGKWAEEVINSINGMQRATPSGDLIDEILSNLSEKQRMYIPTSKLYWASIAASILLALNIYAISTFINTTQMESSNDISLISNFSIYHK